MSDEEITSVSGLNEAIRSLLSRAHDNGVEVEGGWTCRNGPDYPDWDVVVTEVRKKDD